MQAAYSSVFGSATFAPGDHSNLAAWSHAVESALAALKAEADLSGAGCLAVDGTSGTMLLLNDAGQPIRQASL
jgi:sugar (pentulose or hexulose) kinase